MFSKNEIKKANELYTNFRSDVVAAGLVDNGFDEDNILISRRDSKARITDKEIIDIDNELAYLWDSDDVINIKTNRRGIYDNLPEAIFHSGLGAENYNHDRIMEALRKQHEEEVAARKFFSLYEAEIDRTRINISLSELEYDKIGKHRTYVDALGQFWPVIRSMDAQTSILFSRTLPYLSEIRNRYEQIAQAISFIIGYSVVIQLHKREIKCTMKIFRLKSIKLGSNATLKGQLTENYAVVEIYAPSKTISDLLPHAPKRAIIDSLLEIFMPVGIPYEIKVRPLQEECDNKIDNKLHLCILGVNAKLTKNELFYESEEQ